MVQVASAVRGGRLRAWRTRGDCRAGQGGRITAHLTGAADCGCVSRPFSFACRIGTRVGLL